jgi:hypothetical protein
VKVITDLVLKTSPSSVRIGTGIDIQFSTGSSSGASIDIVTEGSATCPAQRLHGAVMKARCRRR